VDVSLHDVQAEFVSSEPTDMGMPNTSTIESFKYFDLKRRFLRFYVETIYILISKKMRILLKK
jgi:hypothetical protein